MALTCHCHLTLTSQAAAHSKLTAASTTAGAATDSSATAAAAVPAATATPSVSDLLTAARSGRVDDDTVDVMLAALAEAFPSITAPLVTERDAYLAWSLKRSRAVCGKRRVVGVVGRAHLAGVVAALQRDCGGDTLVFKDLVGQRSSSGGKRKR
jgi:pheromone shutdown protein TraB